VSGHRARPRHGGNASAPVGQCQRPESACQAHAPSRPNPASSSPDPPPTRAKVPFSHHPSPPHSRLFASASRLSSR
jgi:hypothetical protein